MKLQRPCFGRNCRRDSRYQRLTIIISEAVGRFGCSAYRESKSSFTFARRNETSGTMISFFMRTESYLSKGSLLFMRKSTRASARPISIGNPITGGESIIIVTVYGTNKYGNFASTETNKCSCNTIALRIIRSASITPFPIANSPALPCKARHQCRATYDGKNILYTLARGEKKMLKNCADTAAALDVVEKIIAHDCSVAIITGSFHAHARIPCAQLCNYTNCDLCPIDYFSPTQMQTSPPSESTFLRVNAEKKSCSFQGRD